MSRDNFGPPVKLRHCNPHPQAAGAMLGVVALGSGAAKGCTQKAVDAMIATVQTYSYSTQSASRGNHANDRTATQICLFLA